MQEIYIDDSRIVKFTTHGIYYVNDMDNEDFLSFALGYESLMCLAAGAEIEEEGTPEQWEKFRGILLNCKIVTIRDDFWFSANHLIEFDFLQDTTGDLKYTFSLKEQTAKELENIIRDAGWQLIQADEFDS